MSLEYLKGYSNKEGTAEVWLLRDEDGKKKLLLLRCRFSQIVHSLLTHQNGRCGII